MFFAVSSKLAVNRSWSFKILSCNEVIPKESKVSNTGQSTLVSAARSYQNFVIMDGKPQSQAD
jgi:hypothetical protein